MPPTVDAHLSSPHDDFAASLADDRGSSRSLDEVGAVAVLGAMVEQRKRASAPAASELDDGDAVATQRRQRLDPNDDVFQKIR